MMKSRNVREGKFQTRRSGFALRGQTPKENYSFPFPNRKTRKLEDIRYKNTYGVRWQDHVIE